MSKVLNLFGVKVEELKLEDMELLPAIPFNQARLCLNCEHVVKAQVCPRCGSTHHLLLGNILGLVFSKRRKEP